MASLLQHLAKSLTLLLSQYFSASSLRSLPSGVFCSGGGGDDGGEPPGCAAADAAVHHEQVALCGDVEGTTLSPVHCRDNGTASTSIETGDFLMLVSNVDFRFRAGGVCFLPSLAASADDRDPLSPSPQQLPQQGGAEGEKLGTITALCSSSAHTPRLTHSLDIFLLPGVSVEDLLRVP